MQVTAPSVFLPTNTPVAPTNKITELNVTNTPPVVVDTTTDKVSIQQFREPPVTYDYTPVVLSGLRDSKPKGQAASAISQNLLSSLNSYGSGKSPLSISGMLNQVGSLSRETTEFRNEARRVQVSREVAVKSPSPNFGVNTTSDNQSAHLSIKTKDGDTINIEINHRKIGMDGSSLEFSFSVDGSLSEAEQKALGELAEKLGQMGDEFFRSGTAELRNLKGIDTSVISGFNFTLMRPNEKGDFVEQSYEFSVDDTNQTQTLRASDVRGYSVDITTNLGTLVETSTAEASILEPYLELIRQATDDARTDNRSRRFMLDAFESMFEQFITVQPSKTSDSATETTLAAFDSGLPDFTVSIRSKVVHNREFYSQASSLVLTFSQETRIESDADATLVKQESRYELTNNRFEGIFDLENPNITNPNYRYITEHREGNVSRMLSMKDDKVNNLLVEQNVSSEKEVSKFSNYKLVDKDTDEYADRKLQQFAEVLSTLNKNKQFSAVNELLDDSKDNFFI
ncbi:hypothetical protein [Cellvibrio mixtus]|uniref:hypothetical protein n=1 Tax=Cellvibrio mixtus TaxID=39650 RepID=UPI0005869C87|nr:hypothetical protein [Cellvibrio mixtus]